VLRNTFAITDHAKGLKIAGALMGGTDVVGFSNRNERNFLLQIKTLF
jgi:hypothetical protein